MSQKLSFPAPNLSRGGRGFHPQHQDRGRGRGGYQGGRGRGRGGRGSNNNNRGFGRGRGQYRGGMQMNFTNNPQGGFNQPKKLNFYCCSCERGFKSQDQLDEHNKEHIVCGLEGCTFEAHSLVVTKHIRMQHEGNLFQRMKNLSTPEDIQKWKEERKKNFPTAERIQMKKDESKEKAVVGDREPSRNEKPKPLFRYKMQQQETNRQMSFSQYQYRMRQIQFQLNDDWVNRSYAPDINVRDVRVPFFSLNKSKVATLESFYLNAKMGPDGKLKKENKVKWKGFQVKKLERLADSESESEGESLPISDEDEDYEEVGTPRTPPVPAPNSAIKKPSLGLLVDYSSASESEDEQEMEMDSCEAIAKSAGPINNKTDHVETAVQSSVVGTTTDDIPESNNDGDRSADGVSFDSNSIRIDEFEEDAVFKNKRIYTNIGMRGCKRRRHARLLESLLHDQIQDERNNIVKICRIVE